MLRKLIVIAISLNIAFYISGCGEQTAEDPLKTNINKMIYLLEKGKTEEFLDQYSYSELCGNMFDEFKSKETYDEFLKIFKDKMSNKLIKDLKETRKISPTSKIENKSATFYTESQILNFVKIDGNWRLNIDNYLSDPATSPYIYTLF